MIIREAYIRKFIREKLEETLRKSVRARAKSKKSQDITNTDTQGSYEGALLNVRNGKKYLGDPSTGISPPGYWSNFRDELNGYINKAYPELGIKIDNLGVTRSLGAAADPGGNKARIAGSKHGAGLAQDVYMHTKKYGKFTAYKKDNPKLAKDQKLVDAIISFLETPKYKNKVYWGGAFNSGKAALQKGETPKGRGILEFHHFEFASKDMPKYFTPHEAELVKLGLSSKEITSSKKLGQLYKAMIT